MGKEKFKAFTLGVAATLLVTSLVVPTLASKGTKTEELYYNDIKVVVEGKRAELKDASGKEVEPFIINGTTYIPLRAVANALGQTVSWDGKTATAYIGANEEIEQPTVWLKDLDTFTGSAYHASLDEVEFGGSTYSGSLTANNGDIFQNYWYPTCSGSYYSEVSYVLNGKYSHFKGTFYLKHNFKNDDRRMRFLVYADDALVYTSDEMARGKMPVDFDVDISGAAVIKIVWQKGEGSGWRNYDSGSNYGCPVAIGNAGLYK